MKKAAQNHPQGKRAAGLKLVSGTGDSANSRNNFISNLFQEISAFRILWGLTLVTYACIGVGAAFVSFLIEYEAFFKITQQGGFSFWVVLIFEAAKIGTIIVYGFFMKARPGSLSPGMGGLVRCFQILLIALSFTCSLAMVAQSLDRPNLEAVKVEDLKRAEQKSEQDQANVQKQHVSEVRGLRSRFGEKWHQEHETLQAYYEPRIRQLENDLRKEMDNVVGGTFKGSRYEAFEYRKEELTHEYHEKLNVLNFRKESALRELEERIALKEADHRQALGNLAQSKKTALDTIATSTYANDSRASNQMIHALLITLNDGILSLVNTRIEQVTFVCLFSMLIAVLIELCIYITFYSTVMNFSPSLELMFEADRKGVSVKKNS